MIAIRSRTNSDGNGQYSMTDCIEICMDNSIGSRSNSMDARSNSIGSRSNSMDVRSNSIGSRSNSMDARSNSIGSRSNSMDSQSESICGSFEEAFYITTRERKKSIPILGLLPIKPDINKESMERRRVRDMKIYGKSPDEPKTIEQVKNELYIFNAKCGKK
mgnify:CR=1 FL=1|jgi:hypothetical protein